MQFLHISVLPFCFGALLPRFGGNKTHKNVEKSFAFFALINAVTSERETLLWIFSPRGFVTRILIL
jgi:hypothetical protein